VTPETKEILPILEVLGRVLDARVGLAWDGELLSRPNKRESKLIARY
jgi:hypothetical protein